VTVVFLVTTTAGASLGSEELLKLFAHTPLVLVTILTTQVIFPYELRADFALLGVSDLECHGFACTK